MLVRAVMAVLLVGLAFVPSGLAEDEPICVATDVPTIYGPFTVTACDDASCEVSSEYGSYASCSDAQYLPPECMAVVTAYSVWACQDEECVVRAEVFEGAVFDPQWGSGIARTC